MFLRRIHGRDLSRLPRSLALAGRFTFWVWLCRLWVYKVSYQPNFTYMYMHTKRKITVSRKMTLSVHSNYSMDCTRTLKTYAAARKQNLHLSMYMHHMRTCNYVVCAPISVYLILCALYSCEKKSLVNIPLVSSLLSDCLLSSFIPSFIPVSNTLSCISFLYTYRTRNKLVNLCTHRYWD